MSSDDVNEQRPIEPTDQWLQDAYATTGVRRPYEEFRDEPLWAQVHLLVEWGEDEAAARLIDAALNEAHQAGWDSHENEREVDRLKAALDQANAENERPRGMARRSQKMSRVWAAERRAEKAERERGEWAEIADARLNVWGDALDERDGALAEVEQWRERALKAEATLAKVRQVVEEWAPIHGPEVCGCAWFDLRDAVLGDADTGRQG